MRFKNDWTESCYIIRVNPPKKTPQGTVEVTLAVDGRNHLKVTSTEGRGANKNSTGEVLWLNELWKFVKITVFV
jgi:hypothetical protein